MILASAQIKVTIGDIEGNLVKHLELIDKAITHRVDLIVFPEMSLTGYCRKEGKHYIIEESHPAILMLKEISDHNNMIIVVGAPIALDKNIYIGSYILTPNKETKIYTKQFLHEGEELFYSSSFDYNPIIRLKGEIILFAICADIVNTQHPVNAKANNCTLYIPSIFYSDDGIDHGHKILSEYARTNSMQILMSNYAGNLWEMIAGGKSAFWDSNGTKIAQLNSDTEGLLLLEKTNNNWTSKN